MCVKHSLHVCICFLFVIASGLEVQQYLVDAGKNLTLPCNLQQNKEVMWVMPGSHQGNRSTVLENGSLFLKDVISNDSGVYTCSPANTVNDEKINMNVTVRTKPPALVNVSVKPSTILALLLWKVNGTGGYPLQHFTAQYRLANENDFWKNISPTHISPNSRQLEIYKLEPNTTYDFRIWANNQLGDGEMVEVNSTTRISVEEMELARHFLAGAENFDPKVWFIAAGIVMGTLVILGVGTSFLLYQECKVPSVSEDEEVIELVPNIILNPGFDGNPHTERIPADENSNNETTTRLNNNTVIQPRNV